MYHIFRIPLNWVTLDTLDSFRQNDKIEFFPLIFMDEHLNSCNLHIISNSVWNETICIDDQIVDTCF